MTRLFRAPLAILVGATAALPGLLSHCGGGDTHSSPDASDATAQDAPADTALLADATGDVVIADAGAGDGGSAADDAVVDDAATSDATVDAMADATVDAVIDGAMDATMDAGVDATDGGQSSGDASDAEASIDATPCEVDAGDAGDGGPSCAGMQTCCNGWCTDTAKDPRNCGSCGNACSATQFCTGTACDSATFTNICANPKATWITDPYAPDNTAGNDMGAGLATACVPAVTVLTVNENDGIAQDTDSGRPLTGAGDTLVAGGGWFGHSSVAYMDGQGLTPLILGTDGTNAWIRNRKTSVNLVFTTNASVTAHHDFFLLELSVEPTSGTLCFFGYGMLSGGTIAAGYYFQNDVVPNRSTYTDAWYVYEWTDSGDAGVPSAGDTFTLIAHGM